MLIRTMGGDKTKRTTTQKKTIRWFMVNITLIYFGRFPQLVSFFLYLMAWFPCYECSAYHLQHTGSISSFFFFLSFSCRSPHVLVSRTRARFYHASSFQLNMIMWINLNTFYACMCVCGTPCVCAKETKRMREMERRILIIHRGRKKIYI